MECFDHRRVAMTGVQHGDAAGEIDVAFAFDVPQLSIGGPISIDRERIGHATWYRGDTALMEFGIGRHRHSFKV